MIEPDYHKKLKPAFDIISSWLKNEAYLKIKFLEAIENQRVLYGDSGFSFRPVISKTVISSV